MDMTTVRVVTTVILFIVFLGIVAWAWSGRQRAAFEEAARLPLEDEEAGSPTRLANKERAR